MAIDIAIVNVLSPRLGFWFFAALNLTSVADLQSFSSSISWVGWFLSCLDATYLEPRGRGGGGGGPADADANANVDAASAASIPART